MGSVERQIDERGNVLSSEVLCDGSIEDLGQLRRIQRYALKMALADLVEAQQLEAHQLEVGRRAMHQMMAGWDAFPWLVVEDQLVAPVLGNGDAIGGSTIGAGGLIDSRASSRGVQGFKVILIPLLLP